MRVPKPTAWWRFYLVFAVVTIAISGAIFYYVAILNDPCDCVPGG